MGIFYMVSKVIFTIIFATKFVNTLIPSKYYFSLPPHIGTLHIWFHTAIEWGLASALILAVYSLWDDYSNQQSHHSPTVAPKMVSIKAWPVKHEKSGGWQERKWGTVHFWTATIISKRHYIIKRINLRIRNTKFAISSVAFKWFVTSCKTDASTDGLQFAILYLSSSSTFNTNENSRVGTSVSNNVYMNLFVWIVEA